MATLLRTTPAVGPPAFALMLAMGGAGCDKGDPSVSGDGGRADSGTGRTDDNRSSQCMRGQGFSWFPDPDVEGDLNANEPQGLNRTKYEQAQKAREEYAPW